MTLVARSTDGLGKLAGTLADTGADIDTISAIPKVWVPEWVRSTAGRVHRGSSSTTRSWELRTNAELERRPPAGGLCGRRHWCHRRRTGRRPRHASRRPRHHHRHRGGFADHPIPALATVSLGKAALRSAATMLGADLEPDGIRVVTLTIAGQIVAGTSL